MGGLTDYERSVSVLRRRLNRLKAKKNARRPIQQSAGAGVKRMKTVYFAIFSPASCQPEIPAERCFTLVYPSFSAALAAAW